MERRGQKKRGRGKGEERGGCGFFCTASSFDSCWLYDPVSEHRLLLSGLFMHF